MRVFIIGFMGSGKSFTGRRLAELLGYPFVDLDDRIEEQAQKTIAEIFESGGEDAFRAAEKRALRAMDAFTDVVVATGGGAPCFFDNMDWMNQNGLTIYLQTPVEILVQRLEGEKAHRPLVRKVEDLQQFIEEKLRERSTYYLQAAIIYHQHKAQEKVHLNLFEHFDNIIGH